MGRKNVMRSNELAALVLSALRARPHCENVLKVTVEPCREPHPITGAYWAPALVNPGRSGVETCRRELWRVCEELGRAYELAP
jgi:hypothetical protein